MKLSQFGVSCAALTAAIGFAGLTPAQAKPQDASAPAVFSDIPANHWAYAAVNDLAKKGYIKGYPDGTFGGKRSLTRYEFATLISRILQTVDDMNAKIAAIPAPAPAPPVTPTGNFASTDDLAKIQSLVDGFKAQLEAIGTPIAPVQDQIDAIRQDINETKGLVAAAQAAADRAYGFGPAKFRISGYIQGRYQMTESGNQAAYPNGTAASVGAAQDVNGNYAVGGNNQALFLRRARVKLNGGVSANSVFGVQLDVANTSSTTPVIIKEAYATYFLGNNAPAYKYMAAGPSPTTAPIAPSFTVGQFANFFGYTLPQSASEFLWIDHPLAFNEGGSGLWQNQDYDRGANIAVPFLKNFYGMAGVVNGTGTTVITDKRSFDDIYKVAYQNTKKSGFKLIDIGASYYDGEISRSLATNPTLPGGAAEAAFTGPNYQGLKKQLTGAELVVQTNSGWLLQSEYLDGRYDERTFISKEVGGVGTALTTNAYAPNNKVDGYYAVLAYTFKPNGSHPFQLVGGYDVFNRSKSGVGAGAVDQFGAAIAGGASGSSFEDENYGYGFTYGLDKQTRINFYYDQPLKVAHAANVPDPEKIGEFMAQMQVKF